MILLKESCLILQTSNGEQVPCSSEWVSLQLARDKMAGLDPEVVENIAAAVLHYFKHERQQDCVSVEEFATALEKVLRGLGISLDGVAGAAPVMAPVADADLDSLAQKAGDGWELFFFTELRGEIRRMLGHSPRILRFRGLRTCVQHLACAARWNRRCEQLNDQILDYLRTCWQAESGNPTCALVVM
jgi:hypothetical protein